MADLIRCSTYNSYCIHNILSIEGCMNENGQIPKPHRVDLGATDVVDRNVKELIEFYKDKQIPIVNLDIDEDNIEYSQNIQIEFYSDKDELIDKIEIPYDRDQP